MKDQPTPASNSKRRVKSNREAAPGLYRSRARRWWISPEILTSGHANLRLNRTPWMEREPGGNLLLPVEEQERYRSIGRNQTRTRRRMHARSLKNGKPLHLDLS